MNARPDSENNTGDPDEVRVVTRKIFDGSFWVFAGISVSCGLAVWLLKGPTAFDRALDSAVELFIFIFPRMTAAVLIAAFLQLLVPKEVVSRLIGDQAGLKSILIATLAGALTPGGPLTSFPIVVALYIAGANKGALVAYLTSWAMLGFQRSLVWELPLMGEEFTLIRIAASCLLPILAGTIALYLPIRINMTVDGKSP